MPCTLIVVLSWVGFWLNREATSDRVGLGESRAYVGLGGPNSGMLAGITAVLTLSTIALDSRTDLPKARVTKYNPVSLCDPQVHYATALDWYIVCSFLYCMATLLEFAGVHYFTKVRV